MVTGAEGFIGKYVCKALEDSKIEFCRGTRDNMNMADAEGMTRFLKQNRVSHIIHLAAFADNTDGKKLFDSNIAGWYRLLSAAKKSGVKYITFGGTNNVYGEGWQKRIPEDAPCSPAYDNEYALTKYIGELMIEDMLADSEIKYSVMRISDVYGPHQKHGNLIKAIVRAVKENDVIKLYGEGRRTRDYIYVTDVADGMVFATVNELEGVYNLSTGVGTSVKELVELAIKISNGRCVLETVAVDKEDMSAIVLDSEKLRQAGFKAEITLEKGLCACIKE